MKKALLAASLVLIAGALVGCGGGDDGKSAPKGASEDDFCTAFEQVTKDTSGVSQDDTAAQIQAAQDAVAKLADVGTPDSIPDDARAGYELLIDTIKNVDSNASADELTAIFDDFSADDQKTFLAFVTYVGKTCPDLGAPTSTPTQ